MHITPLLSLFFLTLPTYALHILIPMYTYPEDDAWSPIWTQVTAHPTVEFRIIINPDNGPGSSTYPEPAYITALTRLNAHPNVKLLGYVATEFSTRDYATVTAEVDRYAGWSSYLASNISVSGIFFDEATDAKSGAARTYLGDAAAHAYAQLSSPTKTVVLNPGTVVDDGYFSIADSIVEFENPYDDYEGQVTIDSIQSAYKRDSAIIVHSATGLAAAEIGKLVGDVGSSGVGGVYFTSNCCYDGVNGTLLGHIADAVAA